MTFQLPTLLTPRLLLRNFRLSDAARVSLLAGDYDIAQMTSSIPHPYDEHQAIQWIQSHESQFNSKTAIHYAIIHLEQNILIGAIGLELDLPNQSAKLGYWIGKPYWNQGFATEAANSILEYAFGELGLSRVQARHMKKNPASGRVMQKIGMTYEGTLRQSIFRFGNFQDTALYSILRHEFIQ